MLYGSGNDCVYAVHNAVQNAREVSPKEVNRLVNVSPNRVIAEYGDQDPASAPK